jgi:membrane protease YdiL (CAAX protease family)
MADWAAFAGVAGVVTFLVLVLAHASKSLVSGDTGSRPGMPPATDSDSPWTGTGFEAALPEAPPDDSGTTARSAATCDTDDAPLATVVDNPRRGASEPSLGDLSPRVLLANVTLTQGFFACFLLGGVWYAQVPLDALGISLPALSDFALGGVLGLTLFALNQVGASAGRAFGLGGGEELREALAPESFLGWLLLLGVALPVVAGFEELLFRGALVGGLATGFDLSPWLLAVGSSAAFGVGHGAQGRVGMVVTALLGFVFAAAFVLTGSLVVVVVAHYLVNALEFVVYEGVGRVRSAGSG